MLLNLRFVEEMMKSPLDSPSDTPITATALINKIEFLLKILHTLHNVAPHAKRVKAAALFCLTVLASPAANAGIDKEHDLADDAYIPDRVKTPDGWHMAVSPTMAGPEWSNAMGTPNLGSPDAETPARLDKLSNSNTPDRVGANQLPSRPSSARSARTGTPYPHSNSSHRSAHHTPGDVRYWMRKFGILFDDAVMNDTRSGSSSEYYAAFRWYICWQLQVILLPTQHDTRPGSYGYDSCKYIEILTQDSSM